jgi:hypothetical protein
LIDKDNDGFITKDELFRGLQNKLIKQNIKKLDIMMKNLNKLLTKFFKKLMLMTQAK